MKKSIQVTIALFICARLQAQEKPENWRFHFQLTTAMQGHPAFKAAYSSTNSLVDTAEHALSLTSTFYLGRRLWQGAEIYFNPEIAGGKGMSAARGIAGFTNGETFRIGDPEPALYTARLFLQQQFNLGHSDTVAVEADKNQLRGYSYQKALFIRVGKFALSDYFDDNAVSHDPRVSFMNWSLMSNGAWDYPANTRGYTYSLMTEIILPRWEFRAATSMVPSFANGPSIDAHYFEAHAETVEAARKYSIRKQPGMLRILVFRNSSKAPNYKEATASAAKDVIYGTNYGNIKYGFGISVDQQLSADLNVFARASWNDGKTATWAFTEIDRSISAGCSLSGSSWRRGDDKLGFAVVSNGISDDHAAFVASGGYGFIIGDGALKRRGAETIGEIYYNAALFPHCWLTADYQLVNNPAYNKDRGPVNVFAGRLHISF